MYKRKLDVANMASTSKKKNNNIDTGLGIKGIKYCLMPSLQHISAANIIILLWSQVDIQHKIIKLFNECEDVSFFYSISMRKLWRKIEDKVLVAVTQLPVPEHVEKKLSDFVLPIGQEIVKWLIYQDVTIFYDDCLSRKDLKITAIKYLNNLGWTTRGRINYEATAKSLLAKEETLSDDYKYKIACVYCLEDKVREIAPNVINTTLIDLSRRLAMVHFWTSHITGDVTELHKAINYCNTNYGTYECLFKLLVNHGTNEVAIKYIWGKLSVAEKSRQVISAARESNSTDIKFFLLSQMSKEQQEEIFKADARDILLCLVDDWLWGKYFLLTIHNIWHIITEQDYLDILVGIVNIMDDHHEYIKKYDQYQDIFKEVWHCAPKHLIEYVVHNENNEYHQRIFYKLFWKKNLEIIKLMLFDCNKMQKKQIIFSDKGIHKCYLLITSNDWDFLEMFIEHTLFSREDVEHFKQTLIKDKGCNIVEHFIQYKEWDKVAQFLKWAFKSEDEIKEFKPKLVCKIGSKLFKSIVEKDIVDFAELEHFLHWCASGNQESIVEFKRKIPQQYIELVKFMKEQKYKLLEDLELLEEDFPSSSVNIQNHISYDIVILMDNLMKHGDKLEFIRWYFTGKYQVIPNFDNRSRINKHVENILNRFHDCKRLLEEIIIFFNPSSELIMIFKKLFMFSLCRTMLPELDNYI